jgi:hypothetical protein
MPKDEHLGDGLFVSFDGWQYRLWTERSDGVHEVFLEPGVVVAFQNYIERQMRGQSS